MPEFKEKSIPLEYEKERPPVFEESGWELTRKFILRYGDIRVRPEDLGLEEGGIKNTLDLIRRIESRVAERVEEVLPEILERQDIGEAERKIFLEAARNRSFADIDFKDKRKVTAALGLAMVAERARTRAMTEFLNGAEQRELETLGMTPDQRDIVTGLLAALNAGNSEYIRFKARAMSGEKSPERPLDAIREESRISRGIKKVHEMLIAKGPEKVFGEAGADFADYLELYAKGYAPLSEGTGQPISKRWKQEKANRYRDAFEEFVKDRPDFPLILFPRGDEYVSDASGLKLGRDPEIRVAWQSPELKEEAERLLEARDRYIEYLKEHFGDLLEVEDLERIRSNKPIIANDLGYFGIGMQVRFEAQELAGTSIIFKNVQEENRAKTKAAIVDMLGEDGKKFIESPHFIELANTEMMLHEWAHQIHHPEETRGAEALGETESGTNEMKSDLLSYSAIHAIFGSQAEELFGGKGKEAINAYLFGYVYDGAKSMSPDSEERPYYMGAIAILNRLNEAGILRRTDRGVELDKDRLSADWSKEIFEPQARELLELYKRAENAQPEELVDLQKRAAKLGNQAPNRDVEEIIGK